jgi:hypothetical protein
MAEMLMQCSEQAVGGDKSHAATLAVISGSTVRSVNWMGREDRAHEYLFSP